MANSWKNISRRSSDSLRAMQDRRLKQFISRYLYPFSPYYRAMFDREGIDPRSIRTVRDLARVPFTRKKDFIDDANPSRFRDFVLQPDAQKIREAWPPRLLAKMKAEGLIRGRASVTEKLSREFRPVFITFTTGTTNNTPISYLYTDHDMNNLRLSGERMIELFGVGAEDFIVNMFPYAPHLAFWQVVSAGLQSCVLIMSTGGGKTMGTEGNIAALQKVAPSVILGVPSFVYHVLRAARQKGCRFESVKKIVLGASRVTQAYKDRLAALLDGMGSPGVEVLGTYGFTEARCAWGECPTGDNTTSSGYHLYPDKEIFEVVDPETGEPAGEGEDGELVYTSLDSRGSSVLRFRTGDYVKGGITWDPCPHCGRTVPRIACDITRLSDVRDMQLTKVKGTLVNFNNLNEVLTCFPEIEEWQIELCKKDNDPFEVDQIHLYLTLQSGCHETGLAEKVRDRMLTVTEVSPNGVHVIGMEEMVRRLELETGTKDRRILDKRK